MPCRYDHFGTDVRIFPCMVTTAFMTLWAGWLSCLCGAHKWTGAGAPLGSQSMHRRPQRRQHMLSRGIQVLPVATLERPGELMRTLLARRWQPRRAAAALLHDYLISNHANQNCNEAMGTLVSDVQQPMKMHTLPEDAPGYGRQVTTMALARHAAHVGASQAVSSSAARQPSAAGPGQRQASPSDPRQGLPPRHAPRAAAWRRAPSTHARAAQPQPS